MRLTDRERLVIYYFNSISNGFSILGCLFICCMYIKFIELRTFPFRLIFILSIFDIFSSIGYMLPTYFLNDDDVLCQIQAAVINLFTLASVLWAGIIAFSLYYIIVKSNFYIQNYMNYFIIGVIVLCIIVTIIPFITNSYGTVAGWCWIKQDGYYDSKFYERYFLFFIPLWTLVVFNGVLYVKVSKCLKENDDSDGTRSGLNRKLKFYPMILIICFLPYTIKSGLEFKREGFTMKYDYEITIVIATVRGMHGFLNAFVYGFTKKVRRTLTRGMSEEDDSEISMRLPVREDDK
ncbi:hypothetical protein SteCoe_26594 [Stentor coeruleus]|uniref:G-protein coupled receptors family 2 profile 2 domain-containing protein n=1 Tax=Stentor coeruleus TaxID=5963 RepID=A0A1R2BCG2_9CILI|nr:hypothetical protein SteCoe_26594 [Stentor coeruleus]